MLSNQHPYDTSTGLGSIGDSGYYSSQPPYIQNLYSPSASNGFGYLGSIPYIQNPAYGGGFGSGFGGGAPSSGGGFSSSGGGNFSSFGDISNSFGGGGDQQFNQNQPEGYNPYQFNPVFQNLQRPDSPVAGETPEEEYLRQFIIGQLLGPQQGQETAMDQLMSTVQGDYLDPSTNPYLTQSINALGADTTNQLNKSINDILGRAGVGGALGGSRAALMQGQAAGESTRGFNETVANLLNQNYQGERNRQLGAIPGLLSTEQMPIQQAIQAMGLAGIPREFQQQLINAQMAELQRQQNERMLPIQVGQSVLGQRMGQQVPIIQPQQSLLGGLGQLGQGMGSLFSGYNSMFGGGSGPGAAAMGGFPSSTSGYGAGIDPFSGGFDPFSSMAGAGAGGGLMDMLGMGSIGGYSLADSGLGSLAELAML